MALTLVDLRTHVTHPIASADPAGLPPSGGTATAMKNQIVNEAGRHMISAHPWKFRETVSADLGFTADQSYISAPTSLRHLLSISYNALLTSVELTDFQTILDLRARDITPVGFRYWVALIHPRRANATTPPVAPRFEVYPTPTATLAAAMTIFFRAGWTELSSDTDVADIPLYTESLLCAYIRAFSQGYQNEHGETGQGVITLTDRLEQIEAGPLFTNAVREDGLVQPDYGVMGNGLIGSCGSGFSSVVRSQDFHAVGDPWIT